MKIYFIHIASNVLLLTKILHKIFIVNENIGYKQICIYIFLCLTYKINKIKKESF